jgi:hypothetical protein
MRGAEGGWIVRFPGTPGQAGNQNRSEKSGMFFAARKTSIDSPQFTHEVTSQKNHAPQRVFLKTRAKGDSVAPNN